MPKEPRTDRGDGNRSSFHAALYVVVVVLMANLSAIVDAFLHPEIHYFDHEHLIVGGAVGFVTAVVFGVLFLYTRSLERALRHIRTLEEMLPICAHCRQVRQPGADAHGDDAWVDLEAYVSRHTDSQFTHTICPGCKTEHFPELTGTKARETVRS